METKTNLESPLEKETKEENPIQNNPQIVVESSKLSIPMAIIIAGVFIAGAIYFSSVSKPTNTTPTNPKEAPASISPVGKDDRTIGNPQAKVTLVLYEDFQCPFCGAISGALKDDSNAMQYLRKNDPSWTPFLPEVMKHVKSGDMLFVYRDWAFLGPESIRSAEAARCAGDQNKFWEFHDYLYSHQNGENQGGFSDTNLKSFAKNLGLNTTTFNQCLDSNKYEKAVDDSKNEGIAAGITGTPKGFILKDGKVISTIDGAEPLSMVQKKIDAALK